MDDEFILLIGAVVRVIEDVVYGENLMVRNQK